jgi:hypothetical protein
MCSPKLAKWRSRRKLQRKRNPEPTHSSQSGRTKLSTLQLLLSLGEVSTKPTPIRRLRNARKASAPRDAERIKERGRHWSGWAPPRGSARSRGRGPCWTPASGPRSSLRTKNKPRNLISSAGKTHQNLVNSTQKSTHLCLASRCRGRRAAVGDTLTRQGDSSVGQRTNDEEICLRLC